VWWVSKERAAAARPPPPLSRRGEAKRRAKKRTPATALYSPVLQAVEFPAGVADLDALGGGEGGRGRARRRRAVKTTRWGGWAGAREPRVGASPAKAGQMQDCTTRVGVEGAPARARAAAGAAPKSGRALTAASPALLPHHLPAWPMCREMTSRMVAEAVVATGGDEGPEGAERGGVKRRGAGAAAAAHERRAPFSPAPPTPPPRRPLPGGRPMRGGGRANGAGAPPADAPAAPPAPSGAEFALTPDHPLYVTGPTTVTVVSGAAWCCGWTARAGAAPLQVPPGAVATFEASCSDAVTVPRPPAAAVVAVNPAAAASATPPRAPRRPPPPLPPAWRAAAAAFAEAAVAAHANSSPPPRLAVVGPKRAGKSSLARLAANTALAALADAGVPRPTIAWLDGDCGQPEFTAPGLVSLTRVAAPLFGGPGAARETRPVRSHAVGAPSPAPAPDRYAACVRSLATWHAENGGRAPLVINTHGWVAGAGLAATSALLAAAAPTHVLTLMSATPRRNAPAGAWWGAGEGVVAGELPALDAGGRAGGDVGAPDDPTSPCTASLDVKAGAWLPWARAAAGCPPWAAGPPTAAAFAAAAAALAGATPLSVPLALVELQFLGEAPPPGAELRVLNCSVIALATTAEEPGPAGSTASPPAPVLGLALVRAIDGDAGVLHLLTDVAPAAARTARALQVGALELPPALLVGGGAAGPSPYLAPWCLAAGGTGAGVQRARNDLPRGG